MQSTLTFKKLGLACATGLFLFSATALSSSQASAQCLSCVQNLPLPSTNVGITDVQLSGSAIPTTSATASPAVGLFAVNLTGVPAGYAVNNSTTYPGWCADYQSASGTAPGGTYPLINTYRAVPGPYQPVVAGNTFGMINYLLNNKVGTVQDVQDAIWLLLTGIIDHDPSANTTAMVAVAQTNANYVPPVGGVMGVLVGINPVAPGIVVNGALNYQNVLIEVPVAALGTIGDFVWLDANHNGIQDANELTSNGINGVEVKLYSGSAASGTPLQTTVTANNPNSGLPGYYQFQGLPAGTYTVLVDTTSPALAGLQPSILGQGTSSNDSNSNPATTTITTNGSDETIDFGFYAPVVCTGSISGTAWNDANNNGLFEPGESPLVNVAIALSGAASATTVTNSNGAYQFANLCAGTYTVTPAAPTGYTAVATIPSTVPNGDFAQVANPDTGVTLNSASSSVINQDFGYHAPCNGTIGTTTFADFNANGIYDGGDALMNNVTLTLVDLSTGITRTASSSSVNGVNGVYGFAGLCPGSYTVTATAPSGYTPTKVVTPAAGQQTNVSDGKYAVTLTSANPGNSSVDFGFVPPCAGSISGTLWKDANDNGLLQSGENDIASTTLVLFSSNGSTVATTSTSNVSTGLNYKFTGLCMGTYTIGVMPPSGFAYSPVTAPGVPTGSYGNGAKVSLTQENSTVSPVNIGLYQAPAPVISCPNASGTQYSPYSSSAPVTGGVAPFTFSIASGYLPNGLTLNPSTGAITGTPTASGKFAFQLHVADSRGDQSYSSCGSACSITIAPVAAPAISCPNVNSGMVGSSFSSTVAVTGGTGPYKIVIASGSLPAGLSFNNGAITGTPTAYGTFNLVFQVTDAHGVTATTSSCGANCSIAIAPQKCSVSGHAYYGNSKQPIAGQTVTLTGKDCFGNSVTKTVTTASDGSYCHSGLNPGTYQVSVPTTCSWWQSFWNCITAFCQGLSYCNVTPSSGATVTGCDFHYA